MSYLVPKTSTIDEQTIKKSRFITYISRVEDKNIAKAFIANLKQQHPDARHHCWAYIAGHPTTTTDIGFSDDGEPSGTAGKPILNVLRHHGVGQVLLVVVRYFGGIKLGAGGLLRAYSSSASLAMDKLTTTPLISSKDFKIAFDYTLENNIKHLLASHNIDIQKTDYAVRISMHISVPETAIESFNTSLINSTSGKVSLL